MEFNSKMLQALIRTKESNSSDKCRGDVICIKLKEHADWGSMEIRIHKVVDWEDDELERLMRGQLDKTGIPPVLITPYKESEYTEIIENGQVLSEENVTKTRSRKYFDLDLNQQKVKSDEIVNTEFEINKATIKKETLKVKPVTIDSTVNNAESELLESYRSKLNG